VAFGKKSSTEGAGRESPNSCSDLAEALGCPALIMPVMLGDSAEMGLVPASQAAG